MFSGGMFFPKSAGTKVTPKVSKTRGGQGHFWTMSKRKQFFQDYFPKLSNDWLHK